MLQRAYAAYVAEGICCICCRGLGDPKPAEFQNSAIEALVQTLFDPARNHCAKKAVLTVPVSASVREKLKGNN